MDADSVAAMEAAEKPYWAAWRIHDYFNLAVLPGLIILTVGGFLRLAWNTPLALAMFAYVAVDGIWIAFQPHVVGSPGSLLGHHVVTLLIIA